MALFASLGLATKNITHPIVAAITGPLYVPTGAVAGGIYMMWPVMAYGFVRKLGAASMTSLIQAFISLLLPFGNFGLLSFVIYLTPGLAIDAFFLVSRHKACCASCCIAAAAIANVVGTILVGALVLMVTMGRVYVFGFSCSGKWMHRWIHRKHATCENRKNRFRRKIWI